MDLRKTGILPHHYTVSQQSKTQHEVQTVLPVTYADRERGDLQHILLCTRSSHAFCNDSVTWRVLRLLIEKNASRYGG
jgi:hypothetical protein